MVWCMAIRIGRLNIQSLLTGFKDLRKLLERNDFDFFIFSATLLSLLMEIDLMFKNPNYQFFRNNRVGSGGYVAA